MVQSLGFPLSLSDLPLMWVDPSQALVTPFLSPQTAPCCLLCITLSAQRETEAHKTHKSITRIPTFVTLPSTWCMVCWLDQWAQLLTSHGIKPHSEALGGCVNIGSSFGAPTSQGTSRL